ncbi:UNVERIFIED_CONTAM: hypothetical protein Sradi_5616000 [Sesamum radiatum]|uniref:Uncharacterized protein n=1 Tax=Sesamum radiatum TaxID=300843 RepID=A0AAW2KYW6_SESRA
MTRQFGSNGAKTFSLREGDRNTGYFHRRASQRFRTNLIRRIKNAEGSWVPMEDDIRRCITSHFEGVFASSRPQSDDIAKGTEHLRRVVDSSMAETLLQPYTEQEVTKALF